MHIQIAAVGKLKEKYLTLGIAEYAKRLWPYVKLTLTEVPDERAPVSGGGTLSLVSGNFNISS